MIRKFVFFVAQPLALMALLVLITPILAQAQMNSTGNLVPEVQASGVGYPSTPVMPMTDAEITKQVEARIGEYTSVDPLTINVSTTDGVVKLVGEVHSVQQVDALEAIAKRVSGVRAVENDLLPDITDSVEDGK